MTPNKDLLDDCFDKASLQGESFTIYSEEVNTFIVNLISYNEEVESVIKIHKEERNGRKDWKTQTSHHEGMVVYSNDITKSEVDLKT